MTSVVIGAVCRALQDDDGAAVGWIVTGSPDSRGRVEVLPVIDTPDGLAQDETWRPEGACWPEGWPADATVDTGGIAVRTAASLEVLGVLERTSVDALLRRLARRRMADFHAAVHAHPPGSFVAGQSPVPVSGRVYGADEMQTLQEACLDFWLTTGRFNDQFEQALRGVLGVKHLLTVNSGSSANLLAVAALTQPELGDRALRPGDEVITVAAGFPTTVNPLLLYGLVPVFVDIDIPTYNIDVSQLEAAMSERTRAIVLAHTLGNPFDLDAVTAFARKHGLWLVEDCCDALGSTWHGRPVGGFGDIGTLSFYPAHHITMGEGGAVFTNHAKLRRILLSLRDWGRDCHCDPGQDNTCGKRFDWQLGDLPHGYDHKYIYSRLGFNLKITDMQAAVGLAQLRRLDGLLRARRENFTYLLQALAARGIEEHLILPRASEHGDPAWFGFPMTLRDPNRRTSLLKHLEKLRIGTRLLFGGNLARQPYFVGRRYREAVPLVNTDHAMHGAFWIGLYPGLDKAMLDYMADQVLEHLD